MIDSSLLEKMLTAHDFILGEIPFKKYVVSTDSRKLVPESLFICLKGEKHDAFSFVDEIIKNGARIIVYDLSLENETQAKRIYADDNSLVLIGVPSSLVFLQNLSVAHRKAWFESSNDKEIIAMTGSNGKTTTKEILQCLLLPSFADQLLCTEGNLNNHIGVPLTLLRLNDSHKVAVVEMGTNHHGEIRGLCDFAAPTSGLITNIGTGHIEHFKTQQEIFKEKRALYDAIMENCAGKVFVVNTDDDFLVKLDRTSRTIEFGEKASGYNSFVDHDSLKIKAPFATYLIKNPGLFGRHNYHNLGMSLAICLHLFPQHAESFISVAKTLSLPDNNRSVWKTYGEKLVFLDAYNANPHSMKASLDAFVTRLHEKKFKLKTALFVLGDMNELGDLSPEFHREIGSYLASIGAENVYFIGRFSKEYSSGFGGGGLIFTDKASAMIELQKTGVLNESFFFKASRSLQLESMTAIFLK